MHILIKVASAIGLLFFAYSGVMVVSAWDSRNGIEKALWFIKITVGGSVCLALLLH